MVKSLASSWTESKFENEHGLLSCEKDMLAKMMCIIILKAKITAHTHRQLQHNKQIQSYKLEDEDANLVCRCLPLQIATAYGPTTAEHWAVLFFQTYLAFLLLRPAALNWVHVRSHINSASYTSKLWHRHLDEGVAGTWDILAGNQDIPQKIGTGGNRRKQNKDIIMPPPATHSGAYYVFTMSRCRNVCPIVPSSAGQASPLHKWMNDTKHLTVYVRQPGLSVIFCTLCTFCHI